MLTTLLIKDYALIENIIVDFGKGLNIITGETGAGKSILIEAMGLLLGERASTQVIRKEANKSVVEGVFDVTYNKKVERLLSENELDYYDELIIRREITLKGSNRCFINDTPVTLSLIQEVGNLLVDMHGQHDHQSLLRVSTHSEYLDEFGDHENILNKFREKYNELSEINKELFLLRNKEKSIKQEKEIYQFQLKEIETVSPEPGEEEELKTQLNILENSERLLELSNKILESAYDSENSVTDLLGIIRNNLQELSGIDSRFAGKLNDIDAGIAIIEDVSKAIRSYADKIDIETNRLEEIRERLASFSLLKKKYGGTIEKVLGHRDKLREELDAAENFEEKIKFLEGRLDKVRKEAGENAFELSVKRKSSGGIIEKEAIKVISDLGINDSQFKVKISSIKADESSANFILVNGSKYKFNSRGIDEIEFLISTNLGEDLKPLSKIASGGEISRIMLALKTILAKNDKLPVLIFDEIDTGVSGRIAQKVGLTLKNLSEYHQIISITHLPQIASLADRHYSVEKKKHDDRIISTIRSLNEEERINEIAKLLSGEEITGAGIKTAKELLKNKKGGE